MTPSPQLYLMHEDGNEADDEQDRHPMTSPSHVTTSSQVTSDKMLGFQHSMTSPDLQQQQKGGMLVVPSRIDNEGWFMMCLQFHAHDT